MTDPQLLDAAFLDTCANDPSGPVALHLTEFLQPVEGPGQPFFPPTFASKESPYNIDTLADGSSVALIDSVGSQANRIEPLFLEPKYRELVPQISIAYGDTKKGTDGTVSLLEVGHRLGDALVRCTELNELAHEAFVAIGRGNAGPLAKLAPTSLVFGAWDSRATGAKVPRIVQSVIRAWDVAQLKRSAQYFPPLNYADHGVISEKDAENEKSDVAKRGYAAVPSTGEPGGIIARGPIRRDLTINLVALRRLDGEDGNALRAYILGLSVVAAVAPQDPFLRQGCLLVPDPEAPAQWESVLRSGVRQGVTYDPDALLAYARSAAAEFGVGDGRELHFDKKLAEQDKKKKK